MRFNSVFLFAAFLLHSLFQACSSADKEAVVLKFNLQKGKTYNYSMNVDMDNEVQGQKMSSDMNFNYEIAVTDDLNGIKTLSTTYRRIVMNMDAPGMNVEVDTDEPLKDSANSGNPMNMMGKMFHALKGKSFQMKVSEEGQIVEVVGMQELTEAMVSSVSADEQMKNMMRQMFASQFSEENIKQSFSQAFNIFPKKAVKVGDKWDREVTTKGMIAGQFKTTYTVKEINADDVVLDMASTINVAEMKGTQSGTLHVDPKIGLVTDGNMEQKFGGTMNAVSKIKITGKEKQ